MVKKDPDIQELFHKNNSKDIQRATMKWLYQKKRTEKEIKEWIYCAYECPVIKTNDFLPIGLLYISSKPEDVDVYMEMAAKCFVDAPHGSPLGFMQDEENIETLSDKGKEIMLAFDAACKRVELKIANEEEALATKGLVEEHLEQQKRRNFIQKGLFWFAVGLLAGILICLIGTIIYNHPQKESGKNSVEKGIQEKTQREKTEQIKQTADKKNSSDKKTSEQQSSEIEGIAKGKDVNVHLAPGQGIAAKIHSPKGLSVTVIGEGIPDPDGNDLIWWEINMDDYIGNYSEKIIEVLKPKKWKKGRSYYISSEFMQ